jgi:Tfp pilus assembly protein PilO
MPRSFNIAAVKDPRVVMRVIVGILLAANLAAAVVAFKPFGGSAEDLRRDQQRLATQLSQMQARIATSKRLVDKVQTARTQGDQFLNKYFMDLGTASTAVVFELNQTAIEAGIKMGQAQFERVPIEGSDTLEIQTVTVGFEGTYANLVKFMHLVDKSPRFLIIENMQASAPQGQGGQMLAVTLKIDAFIKDQPGASL